MTYFTNFFLKFEHKARNYFEGNPFLHALLAGLGVILFWRGAWEVADIIKLNPILSIVVGILMLVCIGLFVHTFVGNAIIIKNTEKEKQFEQKAKKDIGLVQTEIAEEELTLTHLIKRLEAIENKIDGLHSKNNNLYGKF